MMILKRTLVTLLVTGSGLTLNAGCSSVMTHTGPEQGYYSGTRANIDVLKREDTRWTMTPLIILDIPFSALMDTLLLPYDYARSGKDKQASSPRERVQLHQQLQQHQEQLRQQQQQQQPPKSPKPLPVNAL